MDYVATYGGNYLKHHGILGQKWGVRRYQNEDGTLTAAGKKRIVEKNSSNIKMAKIAKGIYDADTEKARKNRAAVDAEGDEIANKWNGIVKRNGITEDEELYLTENEAKKAERDPNPKYKEAYDNMDEYSKFLDKYVQADREFAEAVWKSTAVENYIKALEGIPFEDYQISDDSSPANGREFVNKLAFDEKYYSDFWDENGMLKK